MDKESKKHTITPSTPHFFEMIFSVLAKLRNDRSDYLYEWYIKDQQDISRICSYMNEFDAKTISFYLYFLGKFCPGFDYSYSDVVIKPIPVADDPDLRQAESFLMLKIDEELRYENTFEYSDYELTDFLALLIHGDGIECVVSDLDIRRRRDDYGVYNQGLYGMQMLKWEREIIANSIKFGFRTQQSWQDWCMIYNATHEEKLNVEVLFTNPPTTSTRKLPYVAPKSVLSSDKNKDSGASAPGRRTQLDNIHNFEELIPKAKARSFFAEYLATHKTAEDFALLTVAFEELGLFKVASMDGAIPKYWNIVKGEIEAIRSESSLGKKYRIFHTLKGKTPLSIEALNKILTGFPLKIRVTPKMLKDGRAQMDQITADFKKYKTSKLE
jgi:hypothetical protein